MKTDGFVEKATRDAIAGNSSGSFDLSGELPLKRQPFMYSLTKQVVVDKKRFKEQHLVAAYSEDPESDAYKILRTQVQQRAKIQGWNTIMVTSPRPRSGKTVSAVNLALSMAQEFHQTVMLVDCDLAKQGIHTLLGYESNRGIADHLLENIPLSDLIVCPGISKLTVISGGKTIGGSTELLGSAKMGQLVAEMKNRYQNRYIIFDVPSLLEGADAIAFLPYVDAVLMVVESGKTSMTDCTTAVQLVPQEKLLGCVLNRHAAISR
ncbi:AAA family ATPase [Desulfobulbus elongatus]|uniref:AAA family ATPase n=1 Tax=Desulfobulbus elongatus TaxID=53332 RepID=UPI000686FBBA|nr:AAA family ATPase [Desulfobulbus elongatus]